MKKPPCLVLSSRSIHHWTVPCQGRNLGILVEYAETPKETIVGQSSPLQTAFLLACLWVMDAEATRLCLLTLVLTSVSLWHSWQCRITMCFLFLALLSGCFATPTQACGPPHIRLDVTHWDASSCGEPEMSCEATHTIHKARENKLLKSFQDMYESQAEIRIWKQPDHSRLKMKTKVAWAAAMNNRTGSAAVLQLIRGYSLCATS